MFCWAYFRGSLFSEGLILFYYFFFFGGGGEDLLSEFYGMLLISAICSYKVTSPWVYIWEGLLSEEFVRLRFEGLIFWRTYFILLFFFGGGGRLIIGILRYATNFCDLLL